MKAIDLAIRFCCFGYRPLKTPCSFENWSIDLCLPCWKLKWSIQWWVFQFLCQSKRGLPGAITNNWWEEKAVNGLWCGFCDLLVKVFKLAIKCTKMPPWTNSGSGNWFPRYNPLLTYNPILKPTTYLSTIVGTFWPTINYPQNQLPTTSPSLETNNQTVR